MTRAATRIGPLASITLAILLVTAPRASSAEWQIKPFVGVTYGGATTFVDYEHAVGHPNPAVGVSGMLLGEIFGVEADFGYAPGFFQRNDQQLVFDSSATTLTGNIVVALPRRFAEYSLRPYFVGGAGFVAVRTEIAQGVPDISRSLQVMDLGGGVTGFLTHRVGVSWDVRYFRSIDRTFESGLSIGSEQLSFWRANMAVTIRLGGVVP
jgi:hypothetical protein